jgi:hypothetical protein
MAGILRRAVRAGGTRLVLKTAKAVPFVGAAVAVGVAGYEIKKKGLVNGLVSTALDATPFVGLAKNAIEMFTGDWFPDKPTQEESVINPNLSRRDGQRKPPIA